MVCSAIIGGGDTKTTARLRVFCWETFGRDGGVTGIPRKPSVKWPVLGGHSINRCVSHHRDGLSTPTQGGSCCRVRGRGVWGLCFLHTCTGKPCLNQFWICDVLLSQSYSLTQACSFSLQLNSHFMSKDACCIGISRIVFNYLSSGVVN